MTLKDDRKDSRTRGHRPAGLRMAVRRTDPFRDGRTRCGTLGAAGSSSRASSRRDGTQATVVAD